MTTPLIFCRIYIREDDAVGNVIVRVEASDLDDGLNGDLHYSITKGNPKGPSGGSPPFSIDPDTGDISVASPLDYEAVKVYNLVVEATDKGFHPKSASRYGQYNTFFLMRALRVKLHQPCFFMSFWK